MTVTGRIRQWLSGWGLKEWRRAGLVAVLVGTAAFGGLDTVNKKVTDIKPGEMFSTGRFEITVQRASLVDEVRAGSTILFPPKPGRRYLGLVVKARNAGTLPGNVQDVVSLADLPVADELVPMRLADGTQTVWLGPGLTDDLVLLWDVPETAVSVGSDVRVRVFKEAKKLNATVGQGWVPVTSTYGRLAIQVGGRS